MEGGDGPTLDAGHENTVSVVLVLLNEVTWSLFCRNGNEGNALVGRLEPDNLGLLLITGLVMAGVATVTSSPFRFLLLLGSLAAGSKEA
jgi:hypothetical protein